MPGTLPHAFSHDGTSAFRPVRKESFSCQGGKKSCIILGTHAQLLATVPSRFFGGMYSTVSFRDE